MTKLFALALVASMFGASAATAQAGCNGSCNATTSCASAPAAPAAEHANMDTAKAPQSTRSFSYQPSRGVYRSPMTRSRGWSSGTRGAGSKVLGNY